MLAVLVDSDGTKTVPSAGVDGASGADVERVEILASGDDGLAYEVTASTLRVRAAPSAGSPIRGAAARGALVTVHGRDGSWLQVVLPDGTRGWMHGDYLEPVETATASVSGPARSVVASLKRAEVRTPAPSTIRSTFTDVVGRASVTDGDTIRIGETRIRLQGIDAPESGQLCEDGAGRAYPCGGRSANALDTLIAARTVACRRDDIDRYGRTVGTCEVLATGEDLNAAMVGAGWAMAYRQYSMAYVADETAAKSAKRGLWQGLFVPPWDYRAGTRLTRTGATGSGGTNLATATSESAGSCLIKGNISDSGRIYHLPGSKWYDRTRIDTGRGERWFCLEDEAQAAGWRSPRR